ncbi:MAG TPA: serine/threonine-protein kinase [Pirellulales bacterium]|nr:serine/threonine-protein kinase [Pirellulales bacterium]
MSRDRSVEGELHATNAAESRFDDPRVVAAVHEFQAALEAGRAPSKREFLARYPEVAAELQECLEALEVVHGAAPEMRRNVVDEPAPLGAAPKLLGDYRLLRELGRGGMGIVYEAVQISLNRRVAIKMLPFAAGLDRTHLQRFRNEAQAAAQLHHTHIVPVYAVGAERGVHFYAMQLIEGEPLNRLISYLRQLAGKETAQETQGPAVAGDCPTQTMSSRPIRAGSDSGAKGRSSTGSTVGDSSSARLLAREGTNSTRFRLAADLMRQAATGLEHAHQCGVVHRDVKPANLLVNEHGNLWITDFGLAHIQADVTLTRTGDVLGTLRYMSPEQAAGNRLVLDHRTDVYSLGATFYELLALEPVFPDNERHVLLRRIIEDEPRPPRSIDPRIPLELETIVLKAIAKAPQDRYVSAQQLADDLERWLADKPVLARRPTLKEQVVKWCRRHRSLVKMAAVFLGFAFVGLAASTAIIAFEHSKTKQAYAGEMNQRVAADESFRQARQAVDAFTELGEQELAGDPSLQALRRKFLETALAYYQNFLKQRGDDPLVQAELAASSERVGRLIDDLAVLEGFAALPLLAFPPVQHELAIPPAQRPDIERRLAELAAERRRAVGDDRTSEPAVRERQMADVLRSQERQIAMLVNPAQMLRLKQIYWQQLGPFAFLNSEVAAALHLSADDRTRVRQIIDQERPDRQGGPGPGGPGGPGGPKRREPPGDGPPDHRPPEHGFFDGGPGGRGPMGGGPDGRRPPPPPPRGPGGGPGGPGGMGPPRGGPPPHEWGGMDDGPGRPDRGPPRHGGGHEPDDDRHLREMMQAAVQKILDVLSDSQRQAWTQLIGKPFEADLHLRPEDLLPN